MPVAQVIRFDERQAIGRPRRKHAPAPCVILQLHSPRRRATKPDTRMIVGNDEDRIAGRGRDPG
jgi:hypothetical protein